MLAAWIHFSMAIHTRVRPCARTLARYLCRRSETKWIAISIWEVGLLRWNAFAHAHRKNRWLDAGPNTSLESRHPHYSVEDRTSLHFLTLQNGHFLGKRERLCAPKGNFGSNPGISETVGRAESPVFAGLLGHCSAKKQETGRVGWSERIRTRAFPNRTASPRGQSIAPTARS